MSKQHPHLGKQDCQVLAVLLAWGLFNTWPPLSLSTMTRMRLLPKRHSVSCTFGSAFPLLQEFAGLLLEISRVVLHPDDALILGSQRNSVVQL